MFMRDDERPMLVLVAATIVTALLFAPTAGAQHTSTSCKPLCAPTIVAMPALLRSHLFGGPLVRNITTGATSRLPSLSNFEIIVAGAAKTAVPRVSLFGTVQWLPNATEQRNPFTSYTARELGGPVHANASTLTVDGAPRAGDEVPLNRRFLQDARPASLIAGLSIPITPDAP
jgi:hypothetical protein